MDEDSAAYLQHHLISTGQFRSEAMVSDGDLRLEVAKAVVRNVGGDEKVLLRGDRKSHFFKDLQVVRDSRQHTIHGDYERKSDQSELTMLQNNGDYFEVVAGGVHQHATLEAESIVGGAYNMNQVGIYLRMTAFCDFLAWGVWGEADVLRVEMSMYAIRAYMGYAHAVGHRLYMAGTLFDDWINRIENYGTFVDQQGDSTVLGGVGAIVQNEA